MNIFGQRFFVGSILLQFTIILIVENCVKSVIFSLKNEKRKRDNWRYPPFVVSLQLFTGNESNSKHMCLATIIHKRVVLTAAHCFVAHRDAAHWFIVTPTRGKGLCYPVETIWAHAAFQHLDGNDIALVVIKDHFQFGMNETDEDALSKIDYRDPNHRESMERAYFIGWPKEFVNDRSQSSADTLIPFHTIDTFRCIEEYRFIYLTDGELCAMAAPRKAALNVS